VRILVIGDVAGKPDQRMLLDGLLSLRELNRSSLTVVNAETVLDALLANPDIDVLTSGNHSWHKPKTCELIEEGSRLLRPRNYL
jgi:hypothetical protein